MFKAFIPPLKQRAFPLFIVILVGPLPTPRYLHPPHAPSIVSAATYSLFLSS